VGSSNSSARIQIPGLSYTSIGDQINVQGLASNGVGTTFAFNTFSVSATGQNQVNGSGQILTTVQLLQINPASAQAVILGTFGEGDVIVPPAATDVTISAAVNPINNLLYFNVHYGLVNNGQQFIDTMYTYNPNTDTITSLGATFNQGGQLDVRAMTFLQTSPTTAQLVTYAVPNANANANLNPPLQPQLDFFNLAPDGSVIPSNPASTARLVEGYGNAETVIANLRGLGTLPGDSQNLYGIVNSGATSHVIRIPVATSTDRTNRFTQHVATNWGGTTDLFESQANPANPPFDGRNLTGLTFNNVLPDPFNGGQGVMLSVDASTGNLVLVNTRLHIQGDAYAVYVTQSDINSSLTFRGQTLYSGSIGTFAPGGVPGNSGTALLGFIGQTTQNNQTFTDGHPFVTGQLDGSIGILPSVYAADTATTPSNILTAGVVVGRSLQQAINPAAAITTQELGNNFSQVHGSAISRAGQFAVVNANYVGGGATGDRLAFVNPATGAISSTPVNIRLANDTPLRNVQGLAYGSVNLNGSEQLYAIYDLGNGAGPTLGTINTTTGVFTPIGALNIGTLGRVYGMAFSPGGTPADPTHQGLFVVADPDTLDTTQTLYQVNPLTGAALNAPTFNGSGLLTAANGIGQVRDAQGNRIDVAGAAFNGAGRLVVIDRLSGRLMDVNLTTAVAGNVIKTNAGAINPTVGALSFDPVGLKFYVVDNVTGLAPGATSNNNSSVLMTIKDFGKTNGDALNIGGFLFDGTVTGQVYVSGSINTFYAGYLLTGDATNNANNNNFWYTRNNGVVTQVTAADYNYFPNNFFAGGDIRNVLGLRAIGSGNSSTEITAAGKIGAVTSNGAITAVTHAGNQNNIPNLTDGLLVAGNAAPQSEIQFWETSGLNSYTFGAGYVVDSAQNVFPFDNRTIAGAQVLGTIRSSVNGAPDVIHLRGELSGSQPAQNRQNNAADYFAISLLAGQTVDVLVREVDPLTGLQLTTGLDSGLQFGIFDPDGREIATDFNYLDSGQTQGRTIRITAEKPGLYRIGIGFDTAFTQTGNPGAIPYDLVVTGIGDMAIGGVVGGSVVLPGSNNVRNLGLGTGLQANPSVWANTGDVGAVVGRSGGVTASNSSGYSGFSAQSNTSGYGLTAGYVPTGDITVTAGNLRVVQGTTLGQFDAGNNPSVMPDFNVKGKVGLLASTGGELFTTFHVAAGGDIQTISASGELAGIYRTNRGIGVIRAGSSTFGAGNTEFHTNVDNTGADGVIELIDVTGDFGRLNGGGPSIVTGLGGNVRFMQVGGVLWQDTLFATGETGTRGEIVHTPGNVTYTDDSGAVITLIPSVIDNPNAGQVNPDGSVEPATIGGTLTTRTYGIRGAGGVVIVDATSTSGLQVQVASGSAKRVAEISTITVGGAGRPLVITNGVPAVDNTSTARTNDVTITSTGGRVDVFKITQTGGTIDTISNTTGGDIQNITAADVGTITTKGSVGSMASITGALLNPIAVFANTYPFIDQRFGVSVANVGTILADKAIGNILASGVIGTITANRDNVNDQAVFEGITGPIVVNGSAAGTVVLPGTQLTPAISITQVNIGEGIAAKGSGEMARAGIYAAAEIVAVRGSNADIRGDIVSNTFIGTVSLANGSIINSNITVVSDWLMTSTLNAPTLEFPDSTVDIDHPAYNIYNVAVTGNGGIIGSFFGGASINTVSVDKNGFGIFYSVFFTVSQGTINSITAGGYGLRSATINASRVNAISATGTGAPVAISKFSTRVRASEHNTIDPALGMEPSILTDLDLFLNGDGDIIGPSFSGLTTGVIENVLATGQDRLGTLSAYDMVGGTFAFSNSTGAVNVRHDVIGVDLTTGTLKSVTIGNDATDIDFTAAGAMGPVVIKGDFLVGDALFGFPYTGFSEIVAKGPNGSITSVSVGGDFEGDLIAESTIGAVTIGTARKGLPGVGDFSGNIRVGGNGLTTDVLKSLVINGSVIGGTITINGNANTLTVARDLAGLTEDLVINGNLAVLNVGLDPAVNGSVLGAKVTINGNLGKGVITGALTGDLIVKGDVASLTINKDAATSSADMLSGNLLVSGTLAALTVQGGVTGAVVAGRNITAMTVTAGGITATGSVTSSLGSIVKLTVTGDINGAVAAPNGAITALTITGNGNVGDTADISGRSLGTLTLPGSLGGLLTIDNAIGTLNVGAAVAATAIITASALGTLTTKTDMFGTLDIGLAPAAVKLTVGRDFGGDVNADGPLSMTVGRDFVAGGLLTGTNALASLAVKGALNGDVLFDRTIGTITAASVDRAVITAGLGLTSLTVSGAVTNSLVQVGLARGNDGVFGTGDLGEQARMADLGTLSVGSLANSVVAAGGNITTVKSTNNVNTGSVSSGLVLQGTAIAAVLADGTPLADAAELNTARAAAALFRGDMKSVTIGKTGTTLIDGDITAGVSPGADGSFGTADDNVNSSTTGGGGKIGSLKATASANAHILANVAGGGATLVTYTLDGSASSIVPGDPVSGAPTATAVPGTPAVITTANGTITVTVSGPAGTTVSLYDDGATADRLDTLVISSTSTSGVSVTVSTSAAGAFDLGRVLATDGTVVSTFTFNGDLLGGVNGGPALWIDSDMTTFSVRNLPNDGSWTGQIGGNVNTLTVQQLGPGQLRVGGRVSTLNVGGSAGTPLLNQQGTVTPPAGITQLAFNPNTGTVAASDGDNLLDVNVTTGAVGSTVPVHTALNGQELTVNGLAFSNGTLHGVATLNSQLPLTQVNDAFVGGSDHVVSLAVNAAGQVFTVQTIDGDDTLVRIDPATGAQTRVGALVDAFANTFTNSIQALAFGTQTINGVPTEVLYALVNDADGNGVVRSTGSGVALAVIATSDPGSSGFVRVSNPTAGGTAFAPVLLNGGGVTSTFTGLAVASDGTVYAVRDNGGADELVRLTVTGTGSGAAVTVASQGVILANGGATQLVGVGFDENDNLVGLNDAGGAGRDLVAINLGAPATSVRLTAPGLLANPLTAFAVGKTGTTFTAFGMRADGTLFQSPGLSAVLGTFAADGTFTQLLPLAQDAIGTPLAGTVRGVAVDAAGNVFVITDTGVLAEYDGTTGALLGGATHGPVVDNITGNPLDITRIAFDGAGRLIGLNAHQNRLVLLNTVATQLGGDTVTLASGLTDVGTANAADLAGLTFSTAAGRFVSYSSELGALVNILGTSPSTLGGIVASTFGTVNLTADFGGLIAAAGNGSANGIDNLKFTGGNFTGSVTSVGSIGSVTGTGVTVDGAIVSHADIGAVTLTGGVTADGIISADGAFKTFTLTGDLGGFLAAGRGTSFTINGSTLASSLIQVNNDLGSLTITGDANGVVLLNTVGTVKLTGALNAGALIAVGGDANAVTISGGTLFGSLFIAQQGVSSLTVGGTLSGVVAVRRTVGSATLAVLNSGILAVGGDLTNLTVTGDTTDGLITVGTWVGVDGVYNTADDVIYGGSLVTGKINGVFTDSVIAVGVLPREGADAFGNNVPNDPRAYTGNPDAAAVEDIASGESGGIWASKVGTLTFAQPVVSSFPEAGLFSAVIAADGITKLTATGDLQQVVLNDPIGAPTPVTIFDDLGNPIPDITRFSPSEIRIVFTEPLDTATLTSLAFSVLNGVTPINDLTFGYTTQLAGDGSTEGVVRIFSASNFGNAVAGQLTVTIAGGLTLTDRTGLRSALLDFNQDGVPDVGGDPYGTTATTQTVTL
jgi:hypothetical protein